MTTPERFRRRQRIEGTALVILGVFTILMSLYFRAQDIEQRQCLADQFHEFSEVQTKRSAFVDKDSRSTSQVILTVARAKKSTEVRASLDRYIRQQARLNLQREQNPLPPFPEGACE
jgi:hypothetical protein